MTSFVLMITGCSNATTSFWISLLTLPFSELLDGAHLCRYSTLLFGGWVWVEASSRDPGTRNAWDLQPSWLWWKQGSMTSARPGAFSEPRIAPMDSWEEASIINTNAQDREIKDDYNKWKNIFWTQERPHRRAHETIWKDPEQIVSHAWVLCET